MINGLILNTLDFISAKTAYILKRINFAYTTETRFESASESYCLIVGTTKTHVPK